MDKEREAFEAWFLSDATNATHMLSKYKTGGYVENSAFYAWEGWQARAKQTITLPVKDATGEH